MGRIRAKKHNTKEAILGTKAIARMTELTPKPSFVEHGMVLYGKLFQLKDKSLEFTEDQTGFWGELRVDNGERWRVKFCRSLESSATPLFRKQVRVEGDAHYFNNRSPRMTANRIEADEIRDYEAAFAELCGIDSEQLSGISLDELLDSRYGG